MNLTKEYILSCYDKTKRLAKKIVRKRTIQPIPKVHKYRSQNRIPIQLDLPGR